MTSRHALLRLRPDEVGVYDSIDGSLSVAELEWNYPGVCQLLLRWWESGIIELVPPITPPKDPHLVVIEPHMDDAILSAGGRLLHRCKRYRITVLSMVHRSNFTSYWFSNASSLDVDAVTDTRERESELVARLLGAEHQCLDWDDAPLRAVAEAHWSSETIEYCLKNANQFVGTIPKPKDVSAVAEQLLRHLVADRPDELWIPMGLSRHTDHRLARSACLRVLAEAWSLLSGIPVIMYKDVPHGASQAYENEICRVLEDCGVRLRRASEDITDVFDEKLRLVSVYASQFKLSYMEPKIRSCAIEQGDDSGSLVENYYEFLEGSRPVQVPRESRFSPDWAGLARIRKEMHSLLDRQARRVTVLVLPTGLMGRWSTACDSLARAFPESQIHVFVSDDIAWQASEGACNNVAIHWVRRSWRRWAIILCREFRYFGTPTIVIWAGAYRTWRRPGVCRLVNLFVKSILPCRHVTLSSMLDDFCTVLAESRLEENESGFAGIAPVSSGSTSQNTGQSTSGG